MSANNIPYLGSKISLVSKSEIRYEGVLYTIDPNESTVALAKVRSFGTEDRPTDRPVGPREEVYEYIIFRGKDIKDIKVCGPPKPQPTLTGGLPNDPAIVQHSAPTTSGAAAAFQGAAYSKPSTFGPIGGGLPGPSQQFSTYGGSPLGTSAAPGAPIMPGAVSAPQMPPQLAPQPLPPQSQPPLIDLQTPITIPTINDITPALELSAPREATASPILDQIGSTSRSGSPSNSSISRKSPTIDQGVQATVHKDDKFNFQQNQNRREFQERNYQNNRGAPRGYRGGFRGSQEMARNMRRGGRGNFPGRGRLNFKDDYDFDNANQAFEEIKSQLLKTTISDEPQIIENVAPAETEETKKISEEIIKTDGDLLSEEGAFSEELEHANQFYDKDSFFDKISCEALERSKGDEIINENHKLYEKEDFFDSISYEAIERSKSNFQRTDWRQERKLNAETFGIPEYPRRMGFRGNRGFMMRSGSYGGFNRGFRGMRGGRGANFRGGFGFGRGGDGNTSTPNRRGSVWGGRRGRGGQPAGVTVTN